MRFNADLDLDDALDDELGIVFGAGFRGSVGTAVKGKAKAKASGKGRRKKKKKKKRKKKEPIPLTRKTPATLTGRSLLGAKFADLVRIAPEKMRMVDAQRLVRRPSRVERAAPGPCIPTPGCPEPHLERGIYRMVKHAAAQREATSEHRGIQSRDQYRRDVLARLKRIRSLIDKCDDEPTRRKATRRLSVILGRTF